MIASTQRPNPDLLGNGPARWLIGVTCALCFVTTSNAQVSTAENLLPDDGDNFGQTIYAGQSAAQTFTASVAGVIQTVELPLWVESPIGASQPLIVELWGVTPSGEPDQSVVLATRTVSSQVLPNSSFSLALVSVDFSGAGISVAAGDELAIGLSTAEPSTMFYHVTARAFGNTYLDGQWFFTIPGLPWFTNPPDDAGFRVTVAPLATSTFRNGTCATNAPQYSAGPIVLGSQWMASVDDTLASNDFVHVVMYSGAADFCLAEGAVLVDVFGPELLDLPLLPGGQLSTYDIPVAASASLAGVTVSSQGYAFSIGGGAPQIDLYNAYDHLIGY